MRISRAILAASLVLFLAACGERTRLPFAEFGPPDVPAETTPSKPRQTSIDLAGGALTVVSPAGYCVSKKGLNRRAKGSFVLLARCVALGQAETGDGSANVIFTVTTMPQPPGYVPSLTDLTDAIPGRRVIETQDIEGLPLALVVGGLTAPGGASNTHWRGAFALNGQLVMMAMYAPDDSYALTENGADLLVALAKATRDASADNAVKPVSNSAVDDAPRPMVRRFTGLFRPSE